MKLLLCALLLSLSSLYAQEDNKAWFPVRSECYVEQGRIAYCRACNHNFRPIFCRGRIEGRTYYGSFLTAHGNQWVMPGQCMTGQVYAQNPIYDPLVYANAQVNCHQ